MGTHTLNALQEAKLKQLQDQHGALIMARYELRKRIEVEYEKQLGELLRKESILMNEAVALKISKTRIAAAVGTSNWATLKAKYELTHYETQADSTVSTKWHWGTKLLYGEPKLAFILEPQTAGGGVVIDTELSIMCFNDAQGQPYISWPDAGFTDEQWKQLSQPQFDLWEAAITEKLKEK